MRKKRKEEILNLVTSVKCDCEDCKKIGEEVLKKIYSISIKVCCKKCRDAEEKTEKKLSQTVTNRYRRA